MYTNVSGGDLSYCYYLFTVWGTSTLSSDDPNKENNARMGHKRILAQSSLYQKCPAPNNQWSVFMFFINDFQSTTFMCLFVSMAYV